MAKEITNPDIQKAFKTVLQSMNGDSNVDGLLEAPTNSELTSQGERPKCPVNPFCREGNGSACSGSCPKWLSKSRLVNAGGGGETGPIDY